MSAATQKLPRSSASLLNHVAHQGWIERAKAFFEAAFADVTPKPSAIRNMRQEKAPAVFEKHRADYGRLLMQGANLDALLDGIFAMGVELERQRDNGIEMQSIDEIHQQLVDAECEANGLQLKAARTQTKEDCDAAICAGIREMRIERRYHLALQRRSDTLVLLRDQVGYRPVA